MPESLISSGPVDIVTSGTVIAFKGSAIEIAFNAFQTPLNLTPSSTPPLNFSPPATAGFKVIFRFVDEPNVTGTPLSPTVEAKTVEPLILELTLKNFTSPLGGGNIAPIRIGHAFNRNLYVSYRVYELQGGDKSLIFTIYQSRAQEPATPPTAIPQMKEEPKSNA